MSEPPKHPLAPINAVLLGWVIPGAAHLVLGKWQKAILYFVLIVGTFLAGWLITGCENVYFERGRWHVLVQMGAGLITFVLAVGRLAIGREGADPKLTVMGYFEIGTLYTMVAAMLNVLIIMEAVMISLKLRRSGPEARPERKAP